MPYSRKRKFGRTARRARPTQRTFRLLRRLGRARRIQRKLKWRGRRRFAARTLLLPTKGLPNQAFKKFVYWDSQALVPAQMGAVATPLVFRGNSLYDPDQSGTGHQPYGYDQMTVGPSTGSAPIAYNNYYVYKSKIELVVYHTDVVEATNASAPVRIRLYAIPTTSLQTWVDPYGTETTAQESYYGEHLNMKMAIAGPPVTNRCVKKLSMTRKTRTIYNDPQAAKDMLYWATYNNNPTNQWYWLIAANFIRVHTLDPAPTASIQIDIKITYWARMWERKQFPSS